MKISDIRHFLFYSACVAVLALGVSLYARIFATVESAVVIGDDLILHLDTSSIAVLPPHGHEVGKDSLQDPGHHVGVTSSVITAPTDLWVTGISYEVAGAPAFTLHHGTLFRLDARDLQCPTQSPQPLVSVSQDQAHTNHMRFADGYGIFIPKGTPLLLDAMFHNPGAPIGSGETYTDVSLQLRLHIADEEHIPQTAVTYHLLRLSDAPCSIAQGHSFTVPLSPQQFVFSGTHQEQDASYLLIREPSKVVYWGAHTHGWEGGIAVSAKKNGETVEVFTTQHSTEDMYRYDTPHGNRDIMFDTGDVLSIEAIYDASTTSTIRGAMGHLGLFLAPTE